MPKRPSRFSTGAAPRTASTSNPRPSSSTMARSELPRCLRTTLTLLAHACFATFVSASWTIRYTAVSTSGGRRVSSKPASWQSMLRPWRSPYSSADRWMAAASPKLSRTLGLNSQARSWTPRRMSSTTDRSSETFPRTSSALSADSSTLRPTMREASDWLVSSWSSLATRLRSSSWAEITFSRSSRLISSLALSSSKRRDRSVSARPRFSTIALKAAASCPISSPNLTRARGVKSFLPTARVRSRSSTSGRVRMTVGR